MLRNKLAKDYYSQTSNLTENLTNLDQDLECLFGISNSKDLILEGSFDTYASCTKREKIDITSNFKLTSGSQIFDEQKIVCQVKILSLYKYENCIISQIILSIDDLKTIELINQFSSKCNTLLVRTLIL